MRAKIIKVTKTQESKQGAKGMITWTKANVLFRDLDTDKVDGRNFVSFDKEVYPLIENAQKDEVYDFVEGTNANGFKAVVGVKKLDAASAETAVAKAGGSTGQATGSFTAPRSNYETPDERERRQVLIVRQSSLTAALKTLELQKAKIADLGEVFELADEFVSYVFNYDSKRDEKETPMQALARMQNDIPPAA